MRVRVNLETMSDICDLCNVANQVKSDVYLVDSHHQYKVNAKSQLSCMLAGAEWNDVWVECEEDIYTLIEKWVARSSNVSIHN